MEVICRHPMVHMIETPTNYHMKNHQTKIIFFTIIFISNIVYIIFKKYFLIVKMIKIRHMVVMMYMIL